VAVDDLKINKLLFYKMNKEISDEEAYKIFKRYYKGEISTDGDLNFYIRNEEGLWEEENKKGKKLQKMIFDFDDFLQGEKINYNLKKESNRRDFISGISSFLQFKGFSSIFLNSI